MSTTVTLFIQQKKRKEREKTGLYNAKGQPTEKET